MKISQIKYFSTVNGSGIRTAVFVSGCNLHCPGCFNRESWDFEYGHELNDELINKIIDSCTPEYSSGLAILGGEPLDPKNQKEIRFLIWQFRAKFGASKTIWLWSGYSLDKVPSTPFLEGIMDNIDVLVDGPFDKSKKDLSLAFRGSSNQTIWENKNGEWVKSKLNNK